MGDRVVITREAIPELRAVRAALLRRARCMRLHAEQAPNELSRAELARLADEDDAEADRVAAALTALGSQLITPEKPLPPADACNHWGRLVEDLQAHRSAVRRMREDAIHFAETMPEAASLFDRLCAAEQAHALRLRDLIARADPHALN